MAGSWCLVRLFPREGHDEGGQVPSLDGFVHFVLIQKVLLLLPASEEEDDVSLRLYFHVLALDE